MASLLRIGGTTLRLYEEKHNSVSRLVSPLIPAGERCLRFSSVFRGREFGYFKVLMDVGHKRVTYLNWRFTGPQIYHMMEHSVDLTTDDNFQVNTGFLSFPSSSSAFLRKRTIT